MYNCAPRIIANGNKTWNQQQQQTDLLDPCLDWRLLNEPRWSLKQCNYSALNDQKMRSFGCAFSIFIARIKFTILFNVFFFASQNGIVIFRKYVYKDLFLFFFLFCIKIPRYEITLELTLRLFFCPLINVKWASYSSFEMY